MTYQCSWCGRILYSISVFKKHLLDVHLKELSVEDEYHISDSIHKGWYKSHLEKLGAPKPVSEEEWLNQFQILQSSTPTVRNEK